jgi:hypothetical protein
MLVNKKMKLFPLLILSLRIFKLSILTVIVFIIKILMLKDVADIDFEELVIYLRKVWKGPLVLSDFAWLVFDKTGYSCNIEEVIGILMDLGVIKVENHLLYQ